MRSVVVPALVALTIVAASTILPQLDVQYLERPHVMSVSSAQAFLSAVATGGITLTAIVFSIAFVVLQFTVGTYSPRLAPILARDGVMVNALLIFIATFGFALGTLAATDSHGKDYVPAYSMIVVTILLGLSMLSLGRLIQRLGRLQIYQVLQFIGDRARRIIASRPPAAERSDGSARPSGEPSQTVVYTGQLRYVTGIDGARLRALAPGAAIEPACAPGDALSFGTVLAHVYGKARPLSEQEVRSAFRSHSERSSRADLAYSFRLLVDTAIRALSPAVNDAATAIEVLDEMEDLLCRLSVRAMLPGERWERYLELAFDEIRLAAVDQPIVHRRMRALIDSLVQTATLESRKRAATEYVSRIDATIARAALDDVDRREARIADRQGFGVYARDGE